MRALKFAGVISALLIVVFLTQSCDSTSEPVPEELARFNVSAPDTVTTGVPFTVSVTAVGDQGAAPFSSFSGRVDLAVSAGRVSPGNVDLINGRGTVEVVLSGGEGAQTLTASVGSITGSFLLNAGLLAAIPGDPGDPVAGAIPEFDYLPVEDYFSTGHPDLGNVYLSHNIVIVVFQLGTTIGEANVLISGQAGSIVGGLTGINGQAPGILFLKLPVSSHAEMETALSTVNANPRVSVATQDVLMELDAIPGENSGNTAQWAWESTPTGGNWGFERCRVPQMWNLNDAIKKAGRAVMTGIVDVGFYPDHDDLIFMNLDPLDQHDHGIMVSGIIGATYDNNKGIDGVNPFTGMIAEPIPAISGITETTARISCGQAFISEMYSFCKTYTTIKVLNMSLGYNWYKGGIDATNSTAAGAIANSQGLLMKYTLELLSFHRTLPIICVSAGNESNQGFGVQNALNNSPMTNAALAHGVQNIIVVEAVGNAPGTGDGNADLWEHSCVNGQISAPGEDVQTAIVGYYGTASGTSLASPFVSGLVGYLLCVDPNLAIGEVRDILTSNALSVGGGGRPRVDAWASAMDIDRINGNEDVLRMICDIDDGTEDGNKRVNLSTGADYTEEDYDGDGGPGDGQVDMSDFRRWRDWLAQVDGHDLNGSDNHPKKDVNGDHTVGSAAEENVYPRGDFNGDGMLHATRASYVPGSIAGDASDFEVFKTVFSDPDYDAVDLDDLVHSFDLEVDATRFFASGAPPSVLTTLIRDAGSGTVLLERDHTSSEPKIFVTVPYSDSGYDIVLELSNTAYEQDFGDVVFHYDVGDDERIDVFASMDLDPAATFLHTCDDNAGNSRVLLLSDYGIQPGDVLFMESSGLIVQGAGFTGDSIIAVFSASNALLAGSEFHRVPDAIDAGSPFYSDPTWNCGGEPTDIPEDFTINDVAIVTVPAGARYLFVAKHDSKYEDNSDPDDDWRFVLAVVRGSE